jgi:hypothetical protein
VIIIATLSLLRNIFRAAFHLNCDRIIGNRPGVRHRKLLLALYLNFTRQQEMLAPRRNAA